MQDNRNDWSQITMEQRERLTHLAQLRKSVFDWNCFVLIPTSLSLAKWKYTYVKAFCKILSLTFFMFWIKVTRVFWDTPFARSLFYQSKAMFILNLYYFTYFLCIQTIYMILTIIDIRKTRVEFHKKYWITKTR